MRNAHPAVLARKIDNQSAPIVIEQPVLEVMQARKIFAGASAAAIAVQFDVMQQTLGRPVFLPLIQHSRKGQREPKKRPALHSSQIRGSRLNPLIDYKTEMLVERSYAAIPHGRSWF